MLKQKYLNQIRRILTENIRPTPQVFLFGSCLDKSRSFRDIDVGLLGKSIDVNALYRTREKFEESLLPYKVDLVDFNIVEPKFKEEVFSQDIQWLT